MTGTKTRLRFLPTLNLWDNATQEAVRSGQIKLLPGQWVQCGPGAKSRFVKVANGGSLWVMHAEGVRNPTIKTRRFSETCALWLGKIDRSEYRKRRTGHLLTG